MKIIISDLFIFVLLFPSLRKINLSFLHLFGLRICFLKPTREDIKGNKLVSGLVFGAECVEARRVEMSSVKRPCPNSTCTSVSSMEGMSFPLLDKYGKCQN